MQALAVLGIMVVHKCDSEIRPFFHQRVVEDLAHAEIAAGRRGSEEIVMKCYVEQRHFIIDRIEIVEQPSNLTAPILTHSREIRSRRLADLGKQFLVEKKLDMLDRIQPQTVNAGGPDIPVEPSAGLSDHLGIVHVHVHAHQIVKIAFFGIGIRIPLFACKPVDQILFFGVFIPVCPRKNAYDSM